jgi:hypothetical protein
MQKGGKYPTKVSSVGLDVPVDPLRKTAVECCSEITKTGKQVLRNGRPWKAPVSQEPLLSKPCPRVQNLKPEIDVLPLSDNNATGDINHKKSSFFELPPPQVHSHGQQDGRHMREAAPPNSKQTRVAFHRAAMAASKSDMTMPQHASKRGLYLNLLERGCEWQPHAK